MNTIHVRFIKKKEKVKMRNLLKKAAVIYFLMSLWLSKYFINPIYAAGVNVSTIITSSTGSGVDDFYIQDSSQNSRSLYFTDYAPALCAGTGQNRFIYILDAYNSRIKKYNFSGDFNSSIKLSDGFKIDNEGLCGIYSGDTREIIIHSENELYLVDGDGVITGSAFIPDGTRCHRIFSYLNKSVIAYDYNEHKIFKASVDFRKKKAEIISHFDNVLFPWPVSNDSFLCPVLIAPTALCIYKYPFNGGVSFPPAVSHKIRANAFVSQFKFIGCDRKNNYYLRYFTDISQNILKIDADFKKNANVTFEPSFSAGRFNLLYDECVDGDGNVYTLFIGDGRLTVKKINLSDL